MDEDSELVTRLRAAGCVFAEDEARLLIEAAAVGSAPVTTAGGAAPGNAPAHGVTGGRARPRESSPGNRVDAERLERMVSARVGGAPLEQVLGWAELWGRRWAVAPGVFVPRRRSELLVAEALSHLRARSATLPPVTATGAGATGTGATGARALPGPGSQLGGTTRGSGGTAAAVVVDLCCGCGALGGSVAFDLVEDGYDVELHAADLDPAATACARANLAGTGVVHDGDLDAPLPDSLRGRVDVLLCNAPYVPSDAIALMPREARDHEPLLALDGGADGLGILRRAIAAAPAWLRPGGALLFETGHDQAETATTAARASGLTPRIVSDDDLGATAIVAHRP